MSSSNSILDSERRRDSSRDRKDKKVHFSIIKGNSFEDLQNARKDKEKQLEEFITFKQMSNKSISESINKINKISNRLDSQLSNLIFSNTTKNEEKISKKIEIEENLTNSNNSTNKYYLKENLESNFDKYLNSEYANDNLNYDLNKKYDGLDLSSNSSVRQSGIEKKSVKPSSNFNDVARNKYSNISERRNSVTSNSVISEVSHSSKKSQKFEKNMEKIKNISNNLIDDNNFLKNLINRIDDNLNTDKNIESSNNYINTSQKTSNFEMLEKQIQNKEQSNQKLEKPIKISENKLEADEILNKSVNSQNSKYKNHPQNKKIETLNNLINNLTSNNNASIYHSFGDQNQFQPTFKVFYNKETNEANNELVENNTIELVDTLNNSEKLSKDENKRKNFVKLLDKLDCIFKKSIKSYIDQFIDNSLITFNTLEQRKRFFYISMFFSNIRFQREIELRKIRKREITKVANENREIRLFNFKRKIFKEMTRICFNQKQWICKIRYEFSKNFLWQLLDNWKVFVNYRKIKRYFKNKLKEKAFLSLKKNLNSGQKLEEKSIKLFYILTMKYCLYNIRINTKISRKYQTNMQLAKEFRLNKQKNKIFRILKNNTLDILINRKKQLEKLTNKNKNCEYINLKIIHNTQIRNKKTENGETITRITKNNIKII